jgi:hypothetical protein
MTEQKLKEIQNLIEYYQRTNSNIFEEDEIPPLVKEIISDINNILKPNQHQQKPWRKIAKAMHENIIACPHIPVDLRAQMQPSSKLWGGTKSKGQDFHNYPIDVIYNLLYNAYKAGKKVEEELPPRS